MKKKLFIFFILVASMITFFCIFNFNTTQKLKGELLTYNSGNIKLNVYNSEDDNGNIKMHYKDINKIEVIIDFSNYPENANKILNIKLKEGLTYSSLPVLNVTDASYQTKISESNTLFNALEKVETDKIVVEDNSYNVSNNTYPNSIYGDVTYYIKKEIRQITINLNISSDLFRYYGEHIIQNAIVIDVYRNDKKFDSFSNNIKLYDKDTGKKQIEMSSNLIIFYSHHKTIKASTKDNTEYGNYLYVYNRSQEDNLAIVGLPKFRNLLYEIFYPKGTNFETLINNSGIEISNINKYNIKADEKLDDVVQGLISNLPSGINVVIDESQNKIVVVTNDNTFDQVSVAIKYSVKNISELNMLYNNALTKPGDFVESELPSTGLLKITFYDGTTRDITITGGNLKPQIWYPYDIPNIMEFNKLYDGENSNNAYEDDNDNTFIFGPYFSFGNITPSEKTNQVLEYQIDKNYQVVGVSFPRDVRNVAVTDIKYQIYGTCSGCGIPDSNGWYSYDGTISKLIFNKKNIGDESNSYYFKAVKGTVEKYVPNYDTVGGAAKGEHNGVLYGNLKSTVNEANVTLSIYDSNDKTLKRTLTKKVIKEVGKNTISGRTYSDKSVFDKKVVSTGEEFKYFYRISTYKYPYGNRMYMDDVYIYIREPKGLTLNLSKLKLIYMNNLYMNNQTIIDGYNLAENIEINKIERKTDSIYMIKTNRTIGYGITEKETLDDTSRHLDLEVSYSVKDDCNLASITNEEVVAWGNPNYEFLSHISEDKYDMNNNGSTTDTISKLSYNTLTIQKANSFVASTHIVKDDKEYDSYNENNKDTIIDLDYGDSFEYIVKLINNTDKAAKYSILIPIPKKGMNFGSKFQEEEFTWDINLLKEIPNNEDFEILYNISKDVNNMKFVPYSTNMNLNDVNMVKLSSIKEIPIGKEYIFKLYLGLNNKPSEDKKINIWNPVSYLEATDMTGEFNGSKVAIDINYKEISGLSYIDINKNKIYDKNIDIPGVNDLNIELYKLEDNEYIKVKNSDVSNLTGEFIINDVKLLKNNIFALKFSSKLFVANNDILKEGWIYDIDFTKKDKYYYEIGYITDELSPIVKAEDAYIYVGDKIEFENYIKEAYDYKKEKIEFEFGKNGNTTYSSDIPNNNGVATKVGTYYTTYEVTDKYGNKTSTLIKIYVREKTSPPSTNDDVAKYIALGIFSIMLLGFASILYEKQKG